METDPFDKSHRETSSTDEDGTEGTTYKKKKKTNLRPPLFESKESKKSDSTEGDKSISESLWRRLLGQPEGEEAKSATEKLKESADTEAYEVDEKAAELTEEEAANLPLEALSPEEQTAVVQEYLAARQAALIEEQASAVEGDDESLAAERAADLALLDAARQLLREQPEAPYGQPLQRAYEKVAGYFGVSSAEVPEAERVAEKSATSSPDPTPSAHEAAQTWYVRERAPDAGSVSPVMSVPRPETTVVNTERQENHTASALLVGAAVGYLAGRRRGRIKTEKQAAKVEKKLTTQIRDLERTVAAKEQRIRTVAREAFARSRSSRGVDSESLHSRRAPAAESDSPTARPAESKLPDASRTESQPQRSVMPGSELLGAVTLKAVEALPTHRAAEVSRIEPTTTPDRKNNTTDTKSVETMSRSELLDKAANVAVGATNLRRVYETHLVTEQGLRRLLVEHERGGDVQKILRRELVEKESSFERDPRMRNRGMVGALAAGAVVALPTASQTVDKPTRESKVSASDASPMPVPSAKDSRSSSQVAATLTAATLVVIIAVLLYVLFTGG
jgi:hypothetical protein